jgi:tripartite-type tricarboxylate transporter receptor subunit TctC
MDDSLEAAIGPAPRTDEARRRWLAGGAAGLALGALAPAGAFAQAQAYPARPVKMIVSFPAGGVTDLSVRRIADRFQQLYGQTMIIENRPGRGVASAAVAQSQPDGYTIGIIGRSQLSLYHLLRGSLPYHPVDSFTWVSALMGSWFGIYVKADSPLRSISDLIQAARARPGAFRYGTAFGHGGLAHAPMEEFERKAGVNMTHIPFRGDPDSLLQLARGEIELTIAAGSGIPFVQDGRLRLLAWMNPTRNAKWPDVPTLRELGFPYEVTAVVGVGGPKGMNPAHVAFLENAFRTILAERETLDFLEGIYQRPDFMGSAAFSDWARRQLPIEKEIVDRFNLAEGAGGSPPPR